MRDKELCLVLESIYALLDKILKREKLSSDRTDEEMEIIKQCIEGMGGSVE